FPLNINTSAAPYTYTQQIEKRKGIGRNEKGTMENTPFSSKTKKVKKGGVKWKALRAEVAQGGV
ncbi:hypothetical protein ACTXT7_014761, partial [Hymenolepis weldensis]